MCGLLAGTTAKQVILQCKPKWKTSSSIAYLFFWLRVNGSPVLTFTVHCVCRSSCAFVHEWFWVLLTWPNIRPFSLLLMLCKHVGWTYPSSQSLAQGMYSSHSSLLLILFGAWLPVLARLSMHWMMQCPNPWPSADNSVFMIRYQKHLQALLKSPDMVLHCTCPFSLFIPAN